MTQRKTISRLREFLIALVAVLYYLAINSPTDAEHE